MGNCFQCFASSPNRSSFRSSTPGASHNYSSSGKFSTTNSSAGLSRFSTALTDVICSDGETLPTPTAQVFSFAQLKKATRNFRSDMILGVGGFGTVYQGWIDEKNLNSAKPGSGIIVAIKKLNPKSLQGFEEWQSEVNFLGRLSHPNLVKLLGFCWEDKELLLVYEFMQKGSLENHLFRKSAAGDSLSWDLRLKIAIGAARGLVFLHTLEEQVIYRDFKASNILLDGRFNAKLSDFGLAKIGPTEGNSHVTTRVMGTHGYAAPEYIATGHLYVKSDVYGFGVVLLEMLTGLRALDKTRPTGKLRLVDWMVPKLSNHRKLKSIMDTKIDGQYSQKSAILAAQLTLRCLEPEPNNRISMKEVLESLEHIAALEKPSHSSNEKPIRNSPQRRDSSRSRFSPHAGAGDRAGAGTGAGAKALLPHN